MEKEKIYVDFQKDGMLWDYYEWENDQEALKYLYKSDDYKFYYIYAFCPFCGAKNYLSFKDRYSSLFNRTCLHFIKTEVDDILEKISFLDPHSREYKETLKSLAGKNVYFEYTTEDFENQIKETKRFKEIVYNFDDFVLDFKKKRFFKDYKLLAELVKKWNKRGDILFITCNLEIGNANVSVYKLYQFDRTTLGLRGYFILVVKIDDKQNIIDVFENITHTYL